MEFTIWQLQGLRTNPKITVTGSREFTPSDFFDYKSVATIEAANLNEVFRICQRGDDTQDRITRHAKKKLRSISVGDIIMNIDSEFFMFDPLGLTQISVPSVMEYIRRLPNTPRSA